MSEKAPKGEREPRKGLRDECMNCDEEILLDGSNTFAVIYETDNRCNHLFVVCPCCGDNYRVFCNSETLNKAFGVGIIPNPKVNVRDQEGNLISQRRVGGKYAEQEVWEMRYALDEVDMVKPVEISPRHEQQIKAFGETIVAITSQAPDLFWDNMGEEADYRPYPIRWGN